MTLPNAAKPPSGVTRPSPAERGGADPGRAAAPDRSLWGSILGTGAPPAALEPILGSSSVRVQLEALDHLDKDATAQQRAFRRELTIANLCLMVAGVLSALVLASAPMVPAENAGWWAWLPRCMGVATLALGAIAAVHTYKAREGNRLQRWLSARSGAEMARSGVFMTIAERAVSGSSEIALAALELVNRGLLENQRAWFRQRADQHRRSSDWTTSWGGLGTALAFIGGSGAVIASFVPNQTWLAVAGVIGAAVGAYAVNRESLRLDRANAGAYAVNRESLRLDRANAGAYEKAAAALDAIAVRCDTVEADVRAGKPDALRAFTAAITEQLSAEHKRWLEGSAQAEAVLGKLDTQLQRLNSQGKSLACGNGAAEPQPSQTDAASGVGKE